MGLEFNIIVAASPEEVKNERLCSKKTRRELLVCDSTFTSLVSPGIKPHQVVYLLRNFVVATVYLSTRKHSYLATRSKADASEIYRKHQSALALIDKGFNCGKENSQDNSVQATNNGTTDQQVVSLVCDKTKASVHIFQKVNLP